MAPQHFGNIIPTWDSCVRAFHTKSTLGFYRKLRIFRQKLNGHCCNEIFNVVVPTWCKAHVKHHENSLPSNVKLVFIIPTSIHHPPAPDFLMAIIRIMTWCPGFPVPTWLHDCSAFRYEDQLRTQICSVMFKKMCLSLWKNAQLE